MSWLKTLKVDHTVIFSKIITNYKEQKEKIIIEYQLKIKINVVFLLFKIWAVFTDSRMATKV